MGTHRAGLVVSSKIHAPARSCSIGIGAGAGNLDELADEFARNRQRHVVAHDLGQIGIHLELKGGSEIQVRRTIVDAVAAITHQTDDAG